MVPVIKRKIVVCILLSIVTFGIYAIYWQYLLVKNTRALQKNESSRTGEMLCLVFVPFYSLYWWYTRGKIVKDKLTEHGYPAAGNEIAYLVLSIFGLDIVSMAIMQNDFNSLPTESTYSIQQSAKILIALWDLIVITALHILIDTLELWTPVLIIYGVALFVILTVAMCWAGKQEVKENAEFWREVGRREALQEQRERETKE